MLKVGYAMVELDEAYLGIKFGWINLSTLGRFTLEHSQDGNFIPGTRVVVVEATVGREFMHITKIAKE